MAKEKFKMLLIFLPILLMQTITCYESPASHPFIKTGEKEYILQELGQLERSKDQRATPWTEILTSKPVIAFILAMVGGIHNLSSI